MIKFLISFIILFFVYSCKNVKEKSLKNIIEKTNFIEEKKVLEKFIPNVNENKNNTIFYLVGDPYYIEGVEYIPSENYYYNETGLATFYNKELHNVKTLNNDLNKVTELLGRHKTLPLPSIVKVTNLENGLSVTIKVIDRHEDNFSIIEVSRKVAQLLKFYSNKIARVRVEILSDPSKQWKSVSLSMNEPEFNNTIISAPTDAVSISNLDDTTTIQDKEIINIEQPIEIGSEPIKSSQLYIKVYNFINYNEIKETLTELNLSINSTSEKEGVHYYLILGPIKNEEADKIVSSFIMKGYKKTEIILK